MYVDWLVFHLLPCEAFYDKKPSCVEKYVTSKHGVIRLQEMLLLKLLSHKYLSKLMGASLSLITMSFSEVKLPHATKYAHELYSKPKIGVNEFYVVGAA